MAAYFFDSSALAKRFIKETGTAFVLSLWRPTAHHAILLLDAYGKDSSPLIGITFHEVDAEEICRVLAKPSSKPVFVRDDKSERLYIRTGNSTRLLATREAIEYCKIRWQG